MSLSSTRIEQLIAEELAGIITPEDKAILDKAKAEDPEVYKYWEEKHAIFEEYSIQRWLDEKMTPPDVSAIPPRRSNKNKWFAVAACFALLVLAYKFLVNPHINKTSVSASAIQLRLENGKVFDLSGDTIIRIDNTLLQSKMGALTYLSTSTSIESATLFVPAGKEYKLTLLDGSELFMNSATSVRFPLSFNKASAREIGLTGEAYVKAAKNANQPLMLKLSGSASVKVLGTEFNVSSYDNEKQEIALVNGKVLFSAGLDSSLLTPGLVGSYSVGSKIHTEPFDADEILSWRKGIFLFNDKPLKEVFNVIPRWFGMEVVLDNPKVGKQYFTGSFDRNKSIEENLDVLKAYNSIDYSIDENKVIHIK